MEVFELRPERSAPSSRLTRPMSDPKDLVLAAGRRSMTLFKETSAVLARPLFEDMSVARWIAYNRDDAGWLVDRCFEHREAIGLDQI
jgi:hypothetical protein